MLSRSGAPLSRAGPDLMQFEEPYQSVDWTAQFLLRSCAGRAVNVAWDAYGMLGISELGAVPPN